MSKAKKILKAIPPRKNMGMHMFRGSEKKGKTKVTVKYDVGFNNILYIRGQGPGLSWEKGRPLKNVGADEWVWESDASFKDCEFKVLINDQWYEGGENHHIAKGSNVKYTPNFT